MRHRLCMYPIVLSCRMAASTIGKPVRPSHHASKWSLLYDHEIFEYSGLNGLFILLMLAKEYVPGRNSYLPDIGPVDQNMFVKVAPCNFTDPSLDTFIASVQLLGLISITRVSYACSCADCPRR